MTDQFDFHDYYQKGDIVYYLHQSVTGIYSVKELKVTSIYSDLLIATENRGMSYCIDYREQENVFYTLKEANDALKEVSG